MDENILPPILNMSESLCPRSPCIMQAASKLDELRAASLDFLTNVKACFGEGSSQLHDIHEALESFRKGDLSKREAHKSIYDTLEGRNDLRQQLVDILMHSAADWAPGDFDIPAGQPLQLPLAEEAPQFLQPAHQPQMRLPSISSSWLISPQVDQSPGPLTFGNYEDYNHVVSSPPLGLAPLQLPPPPHFWMDQAVNNMALDVSTVAQMPPAVHTAFRNSWQDANEVSDWANDSMSFSPDYTSMLEGSVSQKSPHMSRAGCMHLPMVCGNVELQHHVDMVPQDALSPMPAPQLAYDMSPRSLQDGVSLKSNMQAWYPTNAEAAPTPLSESPLDTEQPQMAEDLQGENLPKRNDSMVEVYTHALCGKTFATLSGVKKHHWGKKVNDLATTTGCWAKHKKPNISWDEHPSCKDRQVLSQTTTPASFVAKQSQPKAVSLQPKAAAASDRLHVHTVPGFPTLDDLPRTVADTLNPGHAGSYSSEDWETRHHTHRLQSRSSFDSLLTAVNLVSQIDAPKPEMQTGSIALHLDTQIAAAEQHAPFIPYVPFTTPSHSGYELPNVPVALEAQIAASEHGMHQLLPTNIEDHTTSVTPHQRFQTFTTKQPGPVKKMRRV